MAAKKSTIHEAKTIADEAAAILKDIQERIKATLKRAAETVKPAKKNKEDVAKKFAAERRLKKQAMLFVKYDQDADGLLNIDEVKKYSKEEFDFDIPDACIDRIKGHLYRNVEGVGPKTFMQVRAAVGIARDEQRAKIRAKLREEQAALEQEKIKKREAEMAEKREKLAKRVKEIHDEAKEKIEKPMKSVESAVATLSESSDALAQSAAATSLEVSMKAAEAEINLGTEQVSALSAEVKECDGESELKDVVGMLEAQIVKLHELTKGFKEMKKNKMGMLLVSRETYRVEVVAALRACAEASRGTAEGLFNMIAGEGAETMTKADISKFLEGNGKQVDQEKLDELCQAAHLTLADANANGDKLTKDDFKRINRYYMLVVKEIVLTDNLKIDLSKQLRRFSVGEVVEVTEGPKLETVIGINRVQVKAFKDGLAGWVTVSGNAGVTFLCPSGAIFKVMAEVALTNDLKEVDNPQTMLPEGELLEVLDWGRTSRSAMALTRIQVRRLGSEAVGWATVAGTDGAVLCAPA
jgi:hypothetical protein